MLGFIRSFALLIGGSLATWALWLAEIFLVKGVKGPAWAQSFSWSALPIAALIAASSSYLLAPGAPRRHHGMFIAAASLLMVAVFFAARSLLATNPAFGFVSEVPMILWFFGMILAAGLAAAADRWLGPLRVWTVAVIFTAEFLALALWLVSDALSSRDNSLFGFPVFLIALLLPLSLRLGRKGRGRDPATVTGAS